MSKKERLKKESLGVRLLLKGWRAKKVASHKKINVHPTTVQRWAKKHEIELVFPYNRHKDRVDLVNVNEIVRLRRKMQKGQKGRYLFTTKEIADICSCSESYVKRILTQHRRGKL